jgi:CheY-like chemotaxis protein
MRHAIEQRPAVILLDLVLPERSGGELLQDLRGDPLTRDVAVVVVSGHVDGMSERERADCDGIVGKPFDVAELLATVQCALQRAAARRAEVAPIAAVSHREDPLRTRRPVTPRRARGRR